MERILREPIEQYLIAKQQAFAQNELANKLRKEYPELIRNIIPDQTR